MTEIRCGECRKKLGEGEYTVLTIKCPRCGAVNTLRAMSPPPERHRAPNGPSHGPQPHHSLDRRQTPLG
ncbi:Com family DNA-binding transcriptional regulator [Acidovorax sp. LjRoot118]|uniref:Com family DNA-binding transcriptional regulator n=1 Tax=unclassified Acidovorax TaxID=2684926 RepID=UPI0009EB8869|nr:Com family DNA-binding transcriptional regulator [Acidovorax sp. Root219]